MIYCERCGLANRENSRYCNECGAALTLEEPVEEPLPGWLREAAVADYLWKGEMLLPEWLSTVRPFRELYGGDAIVLPPPFNEAPAEEPDVHGGAEGQPDTEEISFLDVDEEGPAEADLLLLDDQDLDADPAELPAYAPTEETLPGGPDRTWPDAAVAQGVEATADSVRPLPLDDTAEGDAGPELGGEELLVEVLSETLGDTEPDPILDDSGRPAPVMEAELRGEEEIVAAVFLGPGEEELLADVIEEHAAEPLEVGVARATVLAEDAAADEPRGDEPSASSVLGAGDDERPVVATGEELVGEARLSGTAAESLLSGIPGVTTAQADAPAPPTPERTSEEGRRFQAAAEYVLRPGPEPKPKAKRRRKKK